MAEERNTTPSSRKTFVLCFDGTGNKFQGDGSDSNILKIFRMLDRSNPNMYVYYQPGIGTYITTNSMQTSGVVSRMRSWYLKSKDAAIGSAFAEHVMDGYKFLMRYYSSEDELYFFGFSRGAYTARFLAELLDHVGLLSAGNEEMARFAWKTYSKWAGRSFGNSEKDKEEERKIYEFMRGFRETFSRPVRRIKFLGLFDTVNSVRFFESAWMSRTKFPYTAHSSAKVIRHAVSLDERRAKFRQDLVAGSKPRESSGRFRIHRYQTDLGLLEDDSDPIQQHTEKDSHDVDPSSSRSMSTATALSPDNIEKQDFDADASNIHNTKDQYLDAIEHQSNLTPPRPPMNRHSSYAGPVPSRSTETLQEADQQSSETRPNPVRRQYSSPMDDQSVLEVWFPGAHADIGGGWKPTPSQENQMLSHYPLAWMVHEASLAGLKFDPYKMSALNCTPQKPGPDGTHHEDTRSRTKFESALHASATTGLIHDCLEFNSGIPPLSVISWRLMEWLPFKRMDLRPDGSWHAIRLPLPRGETRDVPDDAKISVAVIRRMEMNKGYRPGNLIVGGGGRGVRTAPEKFGMGEWEVVEGGEGDGVNGVYQKKQR